MKTKLLISIFALILTSTWSTAQIVTINVSGQVVQTPSMQPYPDHMVRVTANPDSLSTFVPIIDSAYTNPNGIYSITMDIPFVLGATVPIIVTTLDCQQIINQQNFWYTGSTIQFEADFAICSDTIPPPSGCDNYFSVTGIQGLVVSFQGGMFNQQPASYSWDFGDGTTGIGQAVTHTFTGQGSFLVSLATITDDSCLDVSSQMIYLGDTIPPLPCDNYISVNSSQGLSVSLYGGMINQQSASYFWLFGDGTSGTGASITHTYAAQGTYTLSLTTITSDSCTDVTYETLTLMDSIPGGCYSYFTAGAGTNLYMIHFEGITQSIYPTTFTWNFGDQTTGTGQSIDHTYPAPGVYMVVMTAVDSTGCSSTFSAPVYVYMYNTLTLNGRVFAGNQSISSCRVQLFSQEPGTTNMLLVQEVYPDSANYYNFFNVTSGIYRILALPDPATIIAGLYLPTYYGETFLWEDATVILLGDPANPYDIHLIPFDSIGGGNGTITGQINTGGKSTLLANQEVLLLDMSGIPLQYTFTDGQGYFSFPSLPFGDYQVYPNITGITTLPVTVQLSSTSPNATVNMTINGNTITGIYEDSVILIKGIYPNPVSSALFIEIEPRQGSDTHLEILDASGRVLSQKIIEFAGDNQLVQVQVSDLAKGIYFLRLFDNKGHTSSRKFLKH